MKKTPVVQKNRTKARKQGFLAKSANVLKARRQKGRKKLVNK